MERAGFTCEYCRIREADCVLDLQIEHIIAEKHGGASVIENLAASCVFCNRHKGSDIASISRTTGQVVRLFNPRSDQWNAHFQISGALITAITEVGEATARLLRFNDDSRVLERQLLQEAGRDPLASHS